MNAMVGDGLGPGSRFPSCMVTTHMKCVPGEQNTHILIEGKKYMLAVP